MTTFTAYLVNRLRAASRVPEAFDPFLYTDAAKEIDRLAAERDALTARVAQLEACLADVKEQLEMRGIRE